MPQNHRTIPHTGRRVDTVFHAPALEQLRQLSPSELDRVINRWLKSAGLSSPSRLTQTDSETLYRTHLGSSPLRLPVLLQVYQRRNRLQVHHVDAFFGAVCRSGAVAGLLVTTGGFTREAVRGSIQFSRPLRCLSGLEWLTELTVRRTGVGRRRLLCWVLDLQGRLANKDCMRKGPHVRG
jgi:restriction endonuclease Mrr